MHPGNGSGRTQEAELAILGGMTILLLLPDGRIWVGWRRRSMGEAPALTGLGKHPGRLATTSIAADGKALAAAKKGFTRLGHGQTKLWQL